MDNFLRCICEKNIIAKIVPYGIEILCRRCKRTHFIPTEAIDDKPKQHDEHVCWAEYHME